MAVAVARPIGFKTELATKRKRKPKRFHDEALNTPHFHDSQKKEFEENTFNIGFDSLIQQIDLSFEASRMVATDTIPVSVAECKLLFSKLKIVKNSLHSTMGQDRVTDLLIILIEEDLTKKVSYDNVIEIYVARKARKIHL